MRERQRGTAAAATNEIFGGSDLQRTCRRSATARPRRRSRRANQRRLVALSGELDAGLALIARSTTDFNGPARLKAHKTIGMQCFTLLEVLEKRVKVVPDFIHQFFARSSRFSDDRIF